MDDGNKSNPDDFQSIPITFEKNMKTKKYEHGIR
jgi:hypothetical protein